MHFTDKFINYLITNDWGERCVDRKEENRSAWAIYWNWIGAWVAFGAAIDNIGLGIAVGIAIGAGLGTKAKKKQDEQD